MIELSVNEINNYIQHVNDNSNVLNTTNEIIHNNSFSENKPKKVVAFIHSTNIAETWGTEILEKLIDIMREYKFFENEYVENVVINNIGKPIDKKLFNSISDKIKIINYSKDYNLFENCTIRQVSTFAEMNPDYVVLYCHTKGVSYPRNHPFVPNILSWSYFMLHNLVRNLERNLLLLEDADILGSNFRDDSCNPPHFSGNFWLANAGYIKELNIDYLKDKYDPEFWLFRNNPTYINAYTHEGAYQNPVLLHTYEHSVDFNLELYLNNKKNSVFFVGIGHDSNGCTNQLISFINGIYDAIQKKNKKLIIVNEFCGDVATKKYIDVHEALNIDKINDFLSAYDTKLVYYKDINMTIVSVKYGIANVSLIDVTEKAINYFFDSNNNKFQIKKGTNLNEFFGDPCNGSEKCLYIFYNINGIEFFEVFYETYKQDILIDYCLNKREIIIENVEYGLREVNTIDITEQAINTFYTNIDGKKMMHIEKMVKLNEIFGDPCIGHVKKLYIKYITDDGIFEKILDEYPQDDFALVLFSKPNNIKWKFQNVISENARKNIKLFNYLLENIVFHPKYYQIASQISQIINNNQDVFMHNKSIIHIRNEEDSIRFWCSINIKNEETFERILNEKYIDIIRKYIPQDDVVIVLTSKIENNKVIEFLRENNYKVFFIQKNILQGREENAIIDLLVGAIMCNNVYIGNYLYSNYCGSTFSYYVDIMTKNKKKKVLLNLDRIIDDEYVS